MCEIVAYNLTKPVSNMEFCLGMAEKLKHTRSEYCQKLHMAGLGLLTVWPEGTS